MTDALRDEIEKVLDANLKPLIKEALRAGLMQGLYEAQMLCEARATAHRATAKYMEAAGQEPFSSAVRDVESKADEADRCARAIRERRDR